VLSVFRAERGFFWVGYLFFARSAELFLGEYLFSARVREITAVGELLFHVKLMTLQFDRITGFYLQVTVEEGA
jgi:hypothetical protein